jgi:hypothetical protein
VIDINIFDRRSHRKKITKENLGWSEFMVWLLGIDPTILRLIFQ